MLRASGVHAGYGPAASALHGVSAEVVAGSILAVVGPNGCGKTTLLRAMLGVLPLRAGEVTLEGRPLAAWGRREVAQRVGLVPQQEEHAFPLRVRDAVMLGRYPHLGAVERPRAQDERAVDEAMHRADVVALASRRTDQLSGGEWQRVRVARALAQQPGVLLLDEPTASLDVRHEMEVFELVAQLARGGLGALVVTHHLNLAARYADRMLLLEHGRPVAAGTPADVVSESTVSRVFGWPVAVQAWRDGAPQLTPLKPSEAAPGGQEPSTS